MKSFYTGSMESQEAFDVDMNRYFVAFRRSWIPALASFLTIAVLAAWYTTRLKPVYEADAKLLFRTDRASSLDALNQINRPEDQEGLSSLLRDQSPLNSEVEVISSRPLLQQTIDTLSLKDKEGNPLDAEDLREQLEVKIVGASDVIGMAYQNADPEQAAAVLNTLANLYIQNSTLTDQSQAESAQAFIAEQIPQTEANVRSAESALREFRERNKVVALEEEARSAVTVLETLDQQILASQAEAQAVKARAGSLRSQIALDPGSAIAVSALSQSPSVQGVLTELQQVQRQLAIERPRFSDTSPIVVRLTERETSLRNLLQREVAKVIGGSKQVPEGLLQIGGLKQGLITDFLAAEVQRAGVENQLSSLERSKALYQQRVNVLPRLEQQQRELERRLKAAQGTYEALLSRSETLKVAQRQVSRDVRIIEPAVVPSKPLSGEKIRVLAMGLVGGTLLAVAIVILLELRGVSSQTDRRRRSSELPETQPKAEAYPEAYPETHPETPQVQPRNSSQQG